MRKINYGFDIAKTVAIRQTGRNTCFLGCGAINQIDGILEGYKNKGIEKFLVCTSHTAYAKCGAWDPCLEAFEKHGIEFVHYDGCVPNPTHTSVDEGVAMGKELGAQAVLAIGGGSPIDAGKSMAILLHEEHQDNNAEELCDFAFDVKGALPIVAINTTHGTGTEVDRFAVVSNLDKKIKPALAYDCIYPEVSINDPEIMVSLTQEQTLFTSLDALNHVNEAATTICTSPYCIMLAREVLDLIHHYLPISLKDPSDLEAKYFLTYAAMVAGICFDIGVLHLTHALEHPLSALKPELYHGEGLCMLLPSVNKVIYPFVGETLADIYANILPGYTGKPEEAETFAKDLEQWLKEMGCTNKLKDHGFGVDDIPELMLSGKCTAGLWDLAPCWGDGKPDPIVCEKIFEESMDWMN